MWMSMCCVRISSLSYVCLQCMISRPNFGTWIEEIYLGIRSVSIDRQIDNRSLGSQWKMSLLSLALFSMRSLNVIDLECIRGYLAKSILPIYGTININERFCFDTFRHVCIQSESKIFFCFEEVTYDRDIYSLKQ